MSKQTPSEERHLMTDLLIQVFEAIRDQDKQIVDFKFLIENQSAKAQTDNLIGKKLREVNPDTAQNGIFEKFKQVANTGVPLQFEDHYNFNGLSDCYCLTVVKFNDGIVVSGAGVDRHKKAQDQIHELNKTLELKNRELRGLHSELQTFNNIAANDYKETLQKLYTSMEFLIANDAPNLSNSGKAGIRKAQMAIQKMKLLTEDIISFSRIPQIDDKIREINLNEVVARVLADFGRQIKDSSAVIDIGELPVIAGYPLLLSLLFHHLLENSLKFKRPDVAPIIKMAHELAPAQPESEILYHRVMISDNGIGFDPKQAQQMFAIFQRLNDNKYRGSGIGLAVCKKIMALHGGFIAAQINDDGGADFCCYFPL